MNYKTDDLRIREIKELVAPVDLLGELPITSSAAQTVWQTRRAIHGILDGSDDRLLVVMGPCSIHDVKAAAEFAGRLGAAKGRLAADLLIVMRVYFEKPRTTVGWKGLINDPSLDGSYRINDGLRIARQLLLDLNEAGMPVGCEFLDMVTPQYIGDLVSWGAIGARTTESQVHRELASGLSCPVGFKNGTDGNMKIALDAIRAAGAPHHFIAVTKAGRAAIATTTGNEDCHMILRGGKQPNYHAENVFAAVKGLADAGIRPRIMIDFSHGNSAKDPQKQIDVGRDVAAQVASGEKSIFGVMVESHLKAGRQDLLPGKDLVYGLSITDACVGWEDSLALLELLADAARKRRLKVGANIDRHNANMMSSVARSGSKRS